MTRQERVILALDVDSAARAAAFVRKLKGTLTVFKVGSVLFTACGPKVITAVQRSGSNVFLDLKYHDIPNTVAGAVRMATRLGVFMLTVHTCGGKEMLEAAAAAAKEEAHRLKRRKPLIVGVTVLTSDKASSGTAAEVVKRARLAKACGLDGVVCSVQEAAAVRKACGKGFVIVTPGIRPAGGDLGDQKRVATPQSALAAGADYLVVGRPILEAKDPVRAVKDLF